MPVLSNQPLDIYHINVFRYIYMINLTDIFGLLSDPSRLRILMLLDNRELCVCQIMGVLDMSQPLVSRNLSLLFRSGLLDDRREGKMVFYRLKRKLPETPATLMKVLRNELSDNETHLSDLQSLGDCTEFQKKTGKCNMQTFLEYMKQKKRSRKR
jgi:ArsR family transcriptional regulator, arsenate/arsenite/antimonite-responsive transcriptional repressor